MSSTLTPQQAWDTLVEGNRRFVSGTTQRPHSDGERRRELVAGQAPQAVIFGCGDSRVPAEMIFDQGLGDMFVVRTAGHVIDSSVLGSIEYGVAILDAPLIVVLGHDGCGAVKAALSAIDEGNVPGGFVRSIVERVEKAAGGLNRYPDPTNSVLRTALSDRFGVPAARIAIGNGSCDVLLAAGEALLEPTRIYAKDCLALASECSVSTFCHVTGGGLAGNLERVIPEGLAADINRASWTPGQIFKLISSVGKVELAEMEKTFNMGVGMIAVVNPEDRDRALAMLTARHIDAWELGTVRSASGEEPRVLMHGEHPNF